MMMASNSLSRPEVPRGCQTRYKLETSGSRIDGMHLARTIQGEGGGSHQSPSGGGQTSSKGPKGGIGKLSGLSDGGQKSQAEGFNRFGGQGLPIKGQVEGSVAEFNLEKGFTLFHFEEVRERDLVVHRPLVVMGQVPVMEPCIQVLSRQRGRSARSSFGAPTVLDGVLGERRYGGASSGRKV